MQSQRRIAKRIREHRIWLTEVGTEVFQYSIESMHADLKDTTLHSLRNISNNLCGMATYWGTRGEIALIDGDSTGWEKIQHSCLLQHRVVRIESALFQRLADHSPLTFYVSRVACLACWSIACEIDASRQSTTRLLSTMATDRAMVSETFWKKRPFEPFVIRLNQILEGTASPTDAGEDFGVYSEILNNWQNEEVLANALFQACDYHCENMIDGRRDWPPEFERAPFDLIPWEIFAIQQVRRQLRLSTPDFNHPLIPPAIAKPKIVQHIEDDFLPRIAELCHEYKLVVS